ncbi:hypothetical protein ACSYAY_01045 [Leptospirillum ferriphilum]|uniref:Lipoprotein n=1 Tax=Leptospirillum ferriphilum TaxID=178606 RepID=A0A1V3SX09_9BACT|nr:hypothetical protein [Leptospirillum ferriphilum]OOH72812.1 hypothetical protein BOX24_05330 [Leptospirillum ferriphilum]
MKKTFVPLFCGAFLFSGCAGVNTDSPMDFLSGPSRAFVSFPYEPGAAILCRTPVPRPSLYVVARTIRALAGATGSVEQVPVPGGSAFGVWSDKIRIGAIRRYLKGLDRSRTVHVNVELLRIGKRIPYLVRSFSVATNRLFLAAAWADGKTTRAVSGFFVPAGQDVFPVLGLSLLAPGFRTCRTVTPDLPGRDILFASRKVVVKKGTTNLELTWETANGTR